MRQRSIVLGACTTESVVNGRETSVLEAEQREKRDCPSTKAPHMKRAATLYTLLTYVDVSSLPRHEDNGGNSFRGLWGSRPWTTTSCLRFHVPLADFAPPRRIHFRCAPAQTFLGLGFASATQIPRYRSRLLTTLGFACHGFLSRLSHLRCLHPHPHPQHQENRHIC